MFKHGMARGHVVRVFKSCVYLVCLFIYYVLISDIYSPFVKRTEDDFYVTHWGSDL